MRLLLVEDDKMLGGSLKKALEKHAYGVDWVQDGEAALTSIENLPFVAIVLDVNLPKLSGIELLKIIRGKKNNTPVLLLTARDTAVQKVEGLDSGADDYLVKPFALRELDLRLRALTRRARAGESRTLLKVADLIFDLDTFSVSRAGKLLTLPALPLKILELLMQRAPGVVSRREIERTVWGDSPPDSDALRVHMHTLRSAIDPPGQRPLVHTLRGIGYQMRDSDAPAA